MARPVVLDASAVMAVANAEPGAERVTPLLGGALISAVNTVEFMQKLVVQGLPIALPRLFLHSCRIEVVPLDLSLAARTAELLSTTRPFGLSFVDRACLALALARDAVVVTANRAWRELDLGLEIEVIR
jgi:PIN domain nuclease of toxin-antitoxin system